MTAERIGLIAGNGTFPLVFAERARRAGVHVAAVAHRGETEPRIAELVDAVTWIDAGQIGAMIAALRAAGVTRAVMAGGITKPRLFENFRPDERALALIARVGRIGDDGLLRALAAELEGEGITVVESTLYLGDLVPAAGVLTRRAPTEAEWNDVRHGLEVARAIGRFDIGQSVVIRQGTVVAVEGIEGTDATIERAGALVRGDFVVVKTCKPTQDRRFDLPATGIRTVETMRAAGGRVLAVEAGRTLMLDREAMIAAADAADLSIVAVEAGTP
ncbi:MAG TPA: UDP-2,3-diacylglucosamine diphosphatase LpxI [Candidatus Limnocylindria bacterium]|nr:UDP-2,3-diacylglucosamine diphosphatase LpxI [Candidatus Limnocylindria bacterium]